MMPSDKLPCHPDECPALGVRRGELPMPHPVPICERCKEPINHDMTPSDERKQQVILQCKAIVHLGNAIAEIYDGYARCGVPDMLVEHIGQRTAAFMEELGDMINATDAATETDEWLNPIFRKAHELWPVSTSSDRDKLAERVKELEHRNFELEGWLQVKSPQEFGILERDLEVEKRQNTALTQRITEMEEALRNVMEAGERMRGWASNYTGMGSNIVSEDVARWLSAYRKAKQALEGRK